MSYLMTLLCLLISTAVQAQDYVTPSLTSDNEVCIFLSSSKPESETNYTFYGYGGDYKHAAAYPGNAFTYVGQQFDGTYLYKWERPDSTTGMPQSIIICDGNTKIYEDKPFVNHALYKDVQVNKVNDVVSQTKVLSKDSTVTLKDGSTTTLTAGADHDFYFESPKDLTFNLWIYYKNYPGTNSDYDDFTNLGKWPGDPLTKLGQLENGNYLYRGVQAKNTDITPTSLIINYDNGNAQYPELDYTPHAYYTNTVTETTVTEVSQYGRAYPTYTPTTSDLDPLAKINSQNEISVFLESPEENATYYAWPWSSEHDDGNWFTANAGWPGSKFTKVGQLENKHYLYKWTQDNHILDMPSSFIICKTDASTQIFNGAFTNHGYYIESTQDNKTTANYSETVTRMADGTSISSRTTYGKRVVYEMNVGSFAGTFQNAQKQLANLRNLGIDVIWLMPIYERGKALSSTDETSKSPYAVKNYKAINSAYGTVDDLKHFVSAAHQLGMDVWLDFVPNHTSMDNPWADPNSKDFHPEYYTGYNKDNPTDTTNFVHPSSGPVTFNDVWQLDYNYEKVDTDATGNTTDVYNPADRAMREILEYWVKTADIDGYRFDMVSSRTIPKIIWSHLTSSLKAIKPSIQFLAEADFTRDNTATPSDFQYDYAWQLNDNLREFGTSTDTYEDNGGMDLAHITSNFLNSINNVNTDPMIYLTNHDKNWNETKKSLNDIWGDNRYAMTVYEFTMPGMPLIYNGQEQNGTVALNYFKDDKISWSTTSDATMMGLIQELSYLKHTHNALNDGGNSSQRGETHVLNTYNHSVLAIERIKGTEHLISVINLAGTDQNSIILGATRGKWRRVLIGNNSRMDNEAQDVDISDYWQLEGIPAHGYEIFTYTGESNNDAAGLYLVTDDSWDNPTKHPMTATGSSNGYNYYRFEIKGSDFDALNTPANGTAPTAKNDPLYFKIQEYYDFLNLGTICKTDQMFAATSADKAQFTENGTKQYDAAKGSNDATSFSIVRSTDDVDKFIITFARSISKPDTGYVSLEIVKKGEIQTGFYLLTPKNISSKESKDRHQWRFNYKEEDPASVGDKYITDLNEEKRNLCSYVIDANQFDSYIPDDRKAGNTIQFRIRQYYIPDGGTSAVDNDGDIDPSSADKDDAKSTFDATKGDYVYEDAHWDAYTGNNDGYFKIIYQPDVSKYIIQLWQTGSGKSGATRVRVYYIRKYNYRGSKIEDVAASNEDVYLYNVDAQKFLYVGNTWGTMASLLYDDLGTRLNISDGETGENANYKLISTRFNGAGIVPNGHMLGIDDFGYNKDADPTDAFDRLDSANIYCDRNNGNRWIIEKADSIDYANTYTLKLFDTKDGRFHYMLADHMDGNSDEAKTKNTQVKYIAADNKYYSPENLYTAGALQDYAAPRPLFFTPRYIVNIGENRGSIKFDFNASLSGKYDIAIEYISREERKLNVKVGSPDGKTDSYDLTSGSTGSWDNYNRTATLHYTVDMLKGTNNISIGDQTEEAPNIAGITITFIRPNDLKYARWQFVTYKDLVAKLKNENAELYGGTTADATFLLTDQGFTRNVTVSWNTDNGQTILDGTGAKSTVAFTKDKIGANPASGMYWNAHITGKGCVYQDVDVPMYGIYQFDAFGFYSGSPTKMYYQYATEIDANGNVTKWSDMLGNTALKETTTTYVDRSTDVSTGRLFYNESVLSETPEHKTTQFIYVPQTTEGAAVDKNGNYKLRIGFYKTGDNSTDYTAVDDVHLHYCGKSPFLLKDSWDADQKNTALTSDVRDNVPVWLEREFWVNQWNAVVLPVTVSTAQLRQIFGDDVQVASPYGLDDDNPYCIKFTPVNLNSGSTAIEAGKFYIVKPSKLIGTTKVMTVDGNGTATENNVTAKEGWNIRYYDLGKHNLQGMLTDVVPLDIKTVGFNVYSKNDTTNHNGIEIHGGFNTMTAPEKSYVFASDGNMYHLSTAAEIGGFRFYIQDVDKNASSSSKAIMFGSLSNDLDAVLAAFKDKSSNGTATGINGVSTINDDNSGNGNNGYVFDLSGRRVATNGDTSNLPDGVYIINGKKYIKK